MLVRIPWMYWGPFSRCSAKAAPKSPIAPSYLYLQFEARVDTLCKYSPNHLSGELGVRSPWKLVPGQVSAFKTLFISSLFPASPIRGPGRGRKRPKTGIFAFKRGQNMNRSRYQNSTHVIRAFVLKDHVKKFWADSTCRITKSSDYH